MANQPQKNHQWDALREGLIAQINEKATKLDPAKKETRKKEVANDLLRFIQIYLPHYAPSPFSRLHHDLAKNYSPIFSPTKKKKQGLKRADAAPRGNAKTTINKALIIMLICLGLKNYIILISNTISQASEILEAVKIELEENQRIAMDYPDVVGMGKTWNQEEIVTKNSIKIKAFGSGKKIRGASHGVNRPDLVILDDLENDEQVITKAQRDKLHNWFLKSILPLGPPNGSMDLIMVGTILHYDSVLVRVMKNPEFESKKYKAIIGNIPQSGQWQKFNELALSLGPKSARAFHLRNHKIMDLEAEVLWPEVQPLVDLMLKRISNKASFDSEYQNEPIDEADRIFKELHFYETPPDGLITFGAIDPALGVTGGDATALVIIGKCKKGLFYVLEACITNIKPSAAIKKAIELQKKYKCQKWIVETVQFQAYFLDQLIETALKENTPMPVVGIKSSQNKEARIISLEPFITNGTILLHKSQKTLIEQLEFFPKADHDDGPDALEMVKNIAFKTLPAGGGVASKKVNDFATTQNLKGY